MIYALANHLWQSTLFALAVGLLTLAFGKHSARVRYSLWLAASIKFLFPFSLLIGLGAHLAPIVMPIGVLMTAPEASLAFSPFAIHAEGAPLTTGPPAPVNYQPVILLSLWLAGFLCIALVSLRRWLRVRRILRAGSRVELGLAMPAVSTADYPEPAVFGIIRPVLLLPEGITDRLTAPELSAVLAHELCHVRWRDNLTAALHMLVEALFWFHPLVWWIGARLIDERERACDEYVLATGGDPRVYAESLVKVCECCLESRVACVAGVSGSNLRQRVEAIMTSPAARRLDLSRKLLLATTVLAAVATPVIVGAPRLVAQAHTAGLPRSFDVASIKPSGAGPNDFTALSLARGEMISENTPLRTFIAVAYGIRTFQVSGGPGWIDSDRYNIDARYEGRVADGQTRAMLRALLADRFNLALHTETKELPVYTLVPAKNGLKLLAPKKRDCAPLGPGMPLPGFKGAPPNPCGVVRGGRGELNGDAITISKVVLQLQILLGRSVIDKTGFTSAFNIHLRWTPDQAIEGPARPGAPAPDPDLDGPSLFTVLEDELGLKLQSGKGPVEIQVIDHVERPSEN